jgi:hypothetical protein
MSYGLLKQHSEQFAYLGEQFDKLLFFKRVHFLHDQLIDWRFNIEINANFIIDDYPPTLLKAAHPAPHCFKGNGGEPLNGNEREAL